MNGTEQQAPNFLEDVKFWGQLRELSTLKVWTDWGKRLRERRDSLIASASTAPDPMAGRKAAAAAELTWILDMVDGAASQERNAVEEENERQEQAKRDAESEKSGAGSDGVSDAPMPTE